MNLWVTLLIPALAAAAFFNSIVFHRSGLLCCSHTVRSNARGAASADRIVATTAIAPSIQMLSKWRNLCFLSDGEHLSPDLRWLVSSVTARILARALTHTDIIAISGERKTKKNIKSADRSSDGATHKSVLYFSVLCTLSSSDWSAFLLPLNEAQTQTENEIQSKKCTDLSSLSE